VKKLGKNLIQQRRGRGSIFRALHKKRVATKYRVYDMIEKTGVTRGKILDIVHSPAHAAPLVKVDFNGSIVFMIAAEGVEVGRNIASGFKAPVSLGNVLPLKNIPIGLPVFNIERRPGDGGKLVRSAGLSGFVLSREKDTVIVKLPSKKLVTFNGACRATIGVSAGGGHTTKPFIKAGNKYKKLKAKRKLYPRVSGGKMNPVDHPFGGGAHKGGGKPRTTRRSAPPGRKVGSIAPKRTGKGKR
jgi:large subunit ribosomal protein L2